MVRPSVAMTKAGKLAQTANASATSLSGRQEGPGSRGAESEPSGCPKLFGPVRSESANVGAPCLTVPGTATTILVATHTGQHLARLDTAVTVAGRWGALPPTHNVRWDSPPSPELPLRDASDLIPHLVRAVRLHRQEPMYSVLRGGAPVLGEGRS